MVIMILVIIVFIGIIIIVIIIISNIIISSSIVGLFCTYLQNVIDSYCTNYSVYDLNIFSHSEEPVSSTWEFK